MALKGIATTKSPEGAWLSETEWNWTNSVQEGLRNYFQS
jgi:hypothetical protein